MAVGASSSTISGHRSQSPVISALYPAFRLGPSTPLLAFRPSASPRCWCSLPPSQSHLSSSSRCSRYSSDPRRRSPSPLCGRRRNWPTGRRPLDHPHSRPCSRAGPNEHPCCATPGRGCSSASSRPRTGPPVAGAVVVVVAAAPAIPGSRGRGLSAPPPRPPCSADRRVSTTTPTTSCGPRWRAATCRDRPAAYRLTSYTMLQVF